MNLGDHDLSPTKKVQRRTLETTFTPKMRKRSFSVKRFKRKKSEGKLKPMLKETVILHAAESSVPTEDIPSSKSPKRTMFDTHASFAHDFGDADTFWYDRIDSTAAFFYVFDGESVHTARRGGVHV